MNNVCTVRATGIAAIATTLAPGRAFQLLQVTVHLSAAGGAGLFTGTLDANAGAAYDLLMSSQDMTAVTDYIYQPDSPLLFDKGDEIDFAWANANGRTYGLEIKYIPM